ncbi:unnamed protein product [Cyclocybe aegerita]|uniref:F-box domain-containing protein n=1 Tax=Cyclocybe aegerita TaxID=1973307 RepID=A0A8S0XSU5_CYCAE|nr:unnamed protein product [Cyclocybe aegerita]
MHEYLTHRTNSLDIPERRTFNAQRMRAQCVTAESSHDCDILAEFFTLLSRDSRVDVGTNRTVYRYYLQNPMPQQARTVVDPFEFRPCEVCGISGNVEEVDISGRECRTPSHHPCPPCVRLGAVDTRILETRAILKQLYQERCDIKLQRNEFHDELVHHLPLEILSRIFCFCMRDGGPTTVSYKARRSLCGLRTKPTGFTLSEVCRRWARIARSTPQLWTRVSIKIHRRNVPLYAQITSAWLARTGSLPLTLDIYQPTRWRVDKSEWANFDATPIFAAINKHSSQWQTVYARVHSSFLGLLQGDGSGAPLLRRLDISTIDSTAPVFMLTNSVPRPTHVSLNRIRFDSVSIAWDTVTHITVTYLPLREVLQLFQYAENLVECTIQTIDSSDFEDITAPPQSLVLRSLQSLHVQWSDVPAVLIDALTVPALSKVYIKAPLDAVSAMVVRSGCMLTSLTIQDPGSGTDGLLELLENTPLLDKLSVDGTYIDDSFFARLSSTAFFDPANSRNSFLPHLSSLTLVSTPSFEWEGIPPIFLSEPENSEWHRRPLSKFWLDIADPDHLHRLEWDVLEPVDPGVIASLKLVKESGVDIRICDSIEVPLF